MDASLKKILRPLSLALRHELEGWRDENGGWHPGDLERRLAELGIHREKSKPLDEMPHLSGDDRRARMVVDGYLQLRAEAGVERDVAVAEFVRESAYTWANRLLALRCMEARSIIEEVILQKAAYAGRSLVHHRFLRKDPDAAAGADDGLFAVLFAEFAARAAELPALFHPHAAAVALRPSVAALKRSVALLSGTETARGQEPATDEVFSAPDAFGWAYQFYQEEEKKRVDDWLKAKKGFKCEGPDIIPKTALYTEPYIVRFLVHNSLGALWMGLHPESRLCDHWEYYVRDADRAPVETPLGGRSVRDFTFLDPALGSGHFHLEAFDLLFAMYREENPALTPREIAASILNRNLFGVDLDERAVQIAEAALWMKAKNAAPELEAADLDTFHDHLVATNIRLPRGRDHLEAFLRQHPEDAPLRPALELVFRSLAHADELGSLLQIEEPVDRELRRLKAQADVASTTPPMQPDMFRATAVQSALPIGVESYEAWKAGALDRLKAQFEQEAEAADSLRAFFGASARKGFALFDIFARRYDIVAANPPYMGSKHMGAMMKSFIERSYPAGKRDLYTAFILRCRELTAHGGRVAMVTQQSWMFLRSFVGIRAVDEQKLEKLPPGAFSGLLRQGTLEVLAHLGEHAFADPSAAGAFVAIFVLTQVVPGSGHRITGFRLTGPKTPEEKAKLLREQSNIHTIGNADVLLIPESPIVYWLTDRLLSALKEGARLYDVADVRQGMATTDNPRFLRQCWEVPPDKRWVPYAKAGGYKKWAGFGAERVNWYGDGNLLKAAVESIGGQHWSRRLASYDRYFQPGLTYTLMARGSMGCRELPEGFIFDVASMCIFPHAEPGILWLGAALNTHVVSFLLRVVTQDLKFHSGYVGNLRIPQGLQIERCHEIAKAAVTLKRELESESLVNPDHQQFSTSRGSLVGTAQSQLAHALYRAASLHALEGVAETVICDAYRLEEEDIALVLAETGHPVGWHPLLTGDDKKCAEGSLIPDTLLPLLARTGTKTFPSNERDALFHSLRAVFAAGRGAAPVDSEEVEADEADDDDDNVSVAGAFIPVPAETFLEELSQKLQMHPISVFLLLKEGIEQGGWRCLPEEKRLTEDRFTVLVLRMLGHRWPKQIEGGDPLPAWADRDGVIPLSLGSSEPPLAARVLERLGGEFPGGDPAAIRAEFEEIVDTPLEAWLAGGFFARHISQFKKRPIAWQLQSQPGRRRSAPVRGAVFACLVFYQRLDADLLPKLRSHYIAVLRTAHETELRTLEALAHPTPDQAARKAELEVLVDELNRFDAQLQAVAETGFGPAPLLPRLRQLAMDDAMLAMKARWLARLRDTLQATPLTDWQGTATALGHHSDFPLWIATAITHLPHHCAKAGAESPDAAKLPEDPTPTTLAAVICAETAAMTATALDRGCAEWWHEWDTQVIDPLRARISTANNALEALAAELESLDGKNFMRAAEIDQEQKRLRGEVKAWKREIKDKTGQAGSLAARIREWTSPEPATWESWLAGSPLFDEVSSLDGRRTAPATIRDFIQQESLYAPDLNDGVRVNIAPLQRAGLLAADVLASKDLDKAIADRAEWRADERRWVREGKLPQPGWWPASDTEARS